MDPTKPTLMTQDDAQVCALVVTAQLMAALPAHRFDVDVCRGTYDWGVVVSWQDGIEADTMALVLDGPPVGVVLLHHVSHRA